MTRNCSITNRYKDPFEYFKSLSTPDRRHWLNMANADYEDRKLKDPENVTISLVCSEWFIPAGKLLSYRGSYPRSRSVNTRLDTRLKKRKGLKKTPPRKAHMMIIR